MKQERVKVRQQKDELEKKESEIETQNKKINAQHELIEKLEQSIELKELTLNQIAKEINKKYEILKEKSFILNNQRNEIKRQESEIRKQKKELEKQIVSIDEQESKLKEQKKYIDSGDKKIIQQAETLQNYVTKMERQRIIVLLSISFIVAIIALVFYIFRAFNIKKRANKKLAEKNIAISNQKEELETQAETLEAANRELEKLSLIAKETDNAIVITDSKGNIQWINEGYTRLYGYTLEELRDNKKKNLIGEHSNLKINDLINIWFGDKQTISYEALNETKDGSWLWAQTTLTPLVDETGNVKMLIGIDSDITKIKDAEKEIETQKNYIEEKNNKLKIALKDITDSLNYAKHIQNAILPPDKKIKEMFPECFIYYKPRGIVSGDFYWMTKRGKHVFFAVVDCTGHGVPGAFISIVGNNILNQAINFHLLVKPSDILYYLNEKINTTLHHTYEEAIIKDGMDIAFCTLNIESNELQFAGAMRPVYFVRKQNEHEETKELLMEAFQDKEVEFLLKDETHNLFSIRGNKNPIGSATGGFINTFKNHIIQLYKDDIIYLFSDGFADQFGGIKGKKFKYKRLNQLLLDIQKLSLEGQKSQIERHIFKVEKWIRAS